MKLICQNCQSLLTPCFYTVSCEHCEIDITKHKNLYTAFCLDVPKAVIFEDLGTLNAYADYYGTEEKTFVKVGSFFDLTKSFITASSGPFAERKFSSYEFNVLKSHKNAAIREKADDFVFIVQKMNFSKD